MKSLYIAYILLSVSAVAFSPVLIIPLVFLNKDKNIVYTSLISYIFFSIIFNAFNIFTVLAIITVLLALRKRILLVIPLSLSVISAFSVLGNPLLSLVSLASIPFFFPQVSDVLFHDAPRKKEDIVYKKLTEMQKGVIDEIMKVKWK